MFTGIVEQMGLVESMADDEGARRLLLSAPILSDAQIGASIAVNGVCLTVVETHGPQVASEVVPETVRRTNLGSLARGDRVNLERPLSVGSRLDGHIVQGHVDGTGEVRSVQTGEEGAVMTISASERLMSHIVEKGSVAVDGVSVTVAGVSEGGFDIALIPHTVESTTLGLHKRGDLVNLETDIVAKYIERLVTART